MTFRLSSPAFAPRSAIPGRHACDGQDRSPPLSWEGVPEGAGSLALIADDPDAPAGTWVHWVLYAIDPGRDGLPEGVPAEETVLGAARQGINDFDRIGYGGPCPPPNGPHRYFFKLYALDSMPDLGPGATKEELERAMDGRVLARTELIGTYRRGG